MYRFFSTKPPIVDGPALMEHFRGTSTLPMVSRVDASQTSKLNGFFNHASIHLEPSVYECSKAEDFTSLPEVLLMGRCNVGKSSLVNSLFTNPKQNPVKYAKVAPRPGYTPCLNFYTVKGQMRLVDSPGYGRKAKDSEGKLVMDYLENRHELRNCFLLLNSDIELNQYDEAIISMLVEMGIPFDLVFNKIDKVRGDKVSSVTKLIEESILPSLKMQPRYYFVNSVPGKIGKRTGVNELRFAMLAAAGVAI